MSDSAADPFTGALQSLRSQSRLRRLTTLSQVTGKYAVIEGATYLNCASNDYLDLAHHPFLADAAARAAREGGTGSAGARLLGGTTSWHASLEKALCQYRPMSSSVSTGSALLFNTGYMANLGLIQGLAPALGTVFSDRDNHASTVDGLLGLGTSLASMHGSGLRSKSGTKQDRSFRRYRHRDMSHLESLLAERDDKDVKPGLVASETLFSMNGDLAPLQELFALQRKYGFWLLLDEAHSTLCLPGLIESYLISGEADLSRTLIMGSFGKAFGGFGAYVCGPANALEYLTQFCRPFIFSTSLPPPVLAAAEAALQIAAAEPERAANLARVASSLRQGLESEGFDLCGSQSHIVPVLFGSDSQAVAASQALRDLGIHAPAIRPPTVPEGKCRLRLSITSAFNSDDMARLIAALVEARHRETRDRQVRDLANASRPSP